MSRFRTEFGRPRWQATLRPASLVLVRVGGAEADARTIEVSPDAGAPAWSAPIAALAGWLAQHGPCRLDIVLSNRFVRFACLPWSDVVTGEEALKTLARLAMESHYGDMAGWTLVVDDAPWGRPRLACSVEDLLLQQFHEVVMQAGSRCQSIVPQFALCWNRWQPGFAETDALLAVAEADVPAVIATIRGGDWQAVRTLGGIRDGEALQASLAREALLQGFETAPAQRVHAPDFVPEAAATATASDAPSTGGRYRPLHLDFARPQTTAADLIGWTFAALASAAIAVLGWQCLTLSAELEAGEREQARLERAAQPRMPAAGEAGDRGDRTDRDALRREMRQARRIIEQLDAPWMALFSAIEAAFDDNVTLLGIEPEPDRREVRLFAEAKDTAAMLAYVRQVRASPVLREVWLASHLVNQQDPLRPVRFTMQARWIAPPAAAPATAVEAEDEGGENSDAVHPQNDPPAPAPDASSAPDAPAPRPESTATRMIGPATDTTVRNPAAPGGRP